MLLVRPVASVPNFADFSLFTLIFVGHSSLWIPKKIVLLWSVWFMMIQIFSISILRMDDKKEWINNVICRHFYTDFSLKLHMLFTGFWKQNLLVFLWITFFSSWTNTTIWLWHTDKLSWLRGHSTCDAWHFFICSDTILAFIPLEGKLFFHHAKVKSLYWRPPEPAKPGYGLPW